jgi:hypothetical protein
MCSFGDIWTLIVNINKRQLIGQAAIMGPLWEWIISKLIGRGMNAENSLRL